jgi:3-dehydroquinate dehydratase
MTANSRTDAPFSARFIDEGKNVLLELMNTSDQPFACVEILTVFLKCDESGDGNHPSRANIKFEPIESIQSQEKIVISHRTWIDGKPATEHEDKLERLKEVAGRVKPYVLDISWQNSEGRARFQRIPVGH